MNLIKYTQDRDSNSDIIKKFYDKFEIYPTSIETDYFGSDLGFGVVHKLLQNNIPTEMFDYLNNTNYNNHIMIIRSTNRGGCSGGNCWGDNAEYYEENDIETYIKDQDFKSFFKYDISKFKLYNFDIVITEYYGNYKNLTYEFILIYDLMKYFSRKYKIDSILNEK